MATKLHSLLTRDDCIMPDGSVQAVATIVRAVNSHSELIEALEFYANPEIYKPHPHGPAFDRRDLSFRARAALAKAKGETT